MTKPKIITIMGPTASGKTGLGVALAKKYNGEIISADSMQIYKNMPIASAAPSVEEMCGVKHHLIGFKNPDEIFSVSDFVELAHITAKKIVDENKNPFIVGGTGLYINSFVNGISFEQEDNKELRLELELEAEKYGIDHMMNKLFEVDPEYAQKLHINDKKRIIRGLERYIIHGKTKAVMDNESKKQSDYLFCKIGLCFKDREKLYNRINQRVDLMVENGLIDEARQAFNASLSKTSVQAIGHKELFPYFENDISLEQAVENLKRATRNYAKRQITWFKKDTEINWICVDECEDCFLEAVKLIDTLI